MNSRIRLLGDYCLLLPLNSLIRLFLLRVPEMDLPYVVYFLSLIILSLLPNSDALYFHIAEGEQKCFIEEIPDNTMVTGNYRVELHDRQTGGYIPPRADIGMLVQARDPDDKIIMHRVYSEKGRFTFTSQSPGEHVICLSTNSTKWFAAAQLRVHLDIQIGDHAIDYANVAQKEKLSELQLRIKQLLDQVDQIGKEQNYQRYREERFRQTSESTNQRVLWWSIGQTTVLLAMGYWQMRHLKSFFEAKKLV